MNNKENGNDVAKLLKSLKNDLKNYGLHRDEIKAICGYLLKIHNNLDFLKIDHDIRFKDEFHDRVWELCLSNFNQKRLIDEKINVIEGIILELEILLNKKISQKEFDNLVKELAIKKLKKENCDTNLELIKNYKLDIEEVCKGLKDLSKSKELDTKEDKK